MLATWCDRLSGVGATILSGVFLAASLICILTGWHPPVDPAWVTVILSGYPLLYLALTRLFKDRWVSSALLISVAMIASLAIGEVFAAGEVAFIMAIGAILEDKTTDRAQRGLKDLMALAPAKARRLKKADGAVTEEIIAADAIVPGDTLRVLPGEIIPADGTISTGTSCVDESVMTGESLPVDKAPGDALYCGTLNTFGSVDFTVTASGDTSSLGRLIDLIQKADEDKAPVQRIADKWAVWLVPVALGIALVTLAVLWATGAPLMTALNRAVTVLVVFCPCALALATPTAIMAAIGQATRHGVLIKSGAALEAMGKADTLAFDKTGTLTRGALTVSDIIPLTPDLTPSDLLALTASAEMKSEHPLARALVDKARADGLALTDPSAFAMTPGRGISAELAGKQTCCGSEAWLGDCGIPLSEACRSRLQQLRSQGKAVILVGTEGVCTGLIALSDTPRPEAAGVVADLNALDTRTVLLTGDNAQAAGTLAQKTGITEIHADLLPQDKVTCITDLRRQGRKVCMVGDGVNDAPALKAADVGVALGTMGSDIAVNAADIALMGDDLGKLTYLRRLSRATVHTITGAITASMCINAVAITLSVLGLLNPVTGALVHNAGSVLVVLCAALLYDRKFD